MDDTLYCLGGYDGNAILNSVERFDPRTGDWLPVATMKAPRSGRHSELNITGRLPSYKSVRKI